MDVIIDFNGYFIPDNKFTIKEFGVINIVRTGFNTPGYDSGVFKSPFNWDELPEQYKLSYFIESQDFGIPWESGSLDFDTQLKRLKDRLENADHIYVKDPKVKYLLETEFRHLHPNCEITPLYEFGYNHQFPGETQCPYHQDKSSHVCAIENVRQMADWFVKNDLKKLPCCAKRRSDSEGNDALDLSKRLKSEIEDN